MQPGRQTSEPRRCSGSRREITQRRAFPLPLLLLGSQRLEFLSCCFGRGRSRHDGKCRPGRLTSGWPHHARAAATVKGSERRPAEGATKTTTRTRKSKVPFPAHPRLNEQQEPYDVWAPAFPRRSPALVWASISPQEGKLGSKDGSSVEAQHFLPCSASPRDRS